MVRLVDWTITNDGTPIVEEFIRLAKLDEIDSQIMRDRAAGNITQLATANKIDRSVEFITKRLKEYLIPKYKEISMKYSHILPIIRENNYFGVNAVINIETEGSSFSVSLQNRNFETFEEIRLEIIKEIKEKYNVDLNELEFYKVFVGGTYLLMR